MAKGVSIKFTSYAETIPKLLTIIKFPSELQKHAKIVIKPYLDKDAAKSTPWQFTEAVLSFCLMHKTPEAEVYIAEGADGAPTMDLFERDGYKKIAEQHSVGLIDLNTAEVEEVIDGEFLKFESIKYPKILFDSFVISLPKLSEDGEKEMVASLSGMLGAYPSRYYSSFFSSSKNKLKKWPTKYSIHDILICKMPEFAIIDASDKGAILAGLPLEMDKQAAKLLGRDWRNVQYIKLVEENIKERPKKESAESAPAKEEVSAEA